MSDTSKITNTCPIHHCRQLSDNGYCRDCGFKWAKPVLRGYTLQYSWAKDNYERDLASAKIKFEKRVEEIRKDAKEANKRHLEDSK